MTWAPFCSVNTELQWEKDIESSLCLHYEMLQSKREGIISEMHLPTESLDANFLPIPRGKRKECIVLWTNENHQDMQDTKG